VLAAIEHHNELKFAVIFLLKITAILAENRFDAALLVISRNQEQKTGLTHGLVRALSDNPLIPWLDAISSSPFWRMRQLKKHLTSLRNEQYTFALPIGKLFSPNTLRVAITKIHFRAFVLGNLRSQRNLRAAIFHPILERSKASHVRRMRKNA